DVLSPTLVSRALQALPHCQLINGYGPTENTTFTCCYAIPSDFDASTSVPIGHGVGNTQVYLLDTQRQPVPIGVTGELYTGGAGLALGYLNQPELTAEKFVPHPFSTQLGARLYRTGDLARYLPDGTIEFVGRADHQVKIRGFRIELGEIETVLSQRGGVRAAVVVVREDGRGDKRLVAYVASSEATPSAQTFREYLRERLPDYMVPADFVFLEALPLSPNGKIDRKALPEPDPAEREVADTVVAPRSEVEERLAAIWQEVLGVQRIRVEANFFDLGGHSLLAIRLLCEVKRIFDADLSLAEMFKGPTIQRMAALLQRKQEGTDAWSPLVPLQPKGERPPLFCAPVSGGSVFYYRKLAEYIDPDQPLYVFEPRGMNGIDAPHATVEEMAAYYIQHMKTVQPSGPYRLCGFSFGGTIAYEMAQQLRAAGEAIECLVLFDCHAPGHGTIETKPWLMGPLYYLYKIRSYKENMIAWMMLGSKKRSLFSPLQMLGIVGLDHASGKARKSTPKNPGYGDLPEVMRKLKSVEDHARSIYVPEIYSDRVLLLRARLRHPSIQPDPKLGWGKFATNLEVVKIPGSHTSMMEDPCVQIILRHVRKELGDV
ncbi:MAG: amino acid adenylation enzyme/thioester reductase family protein, partial [Chthonomonadales bacterium]|nr:amino acid adenylation enzyme/thioester reductase family protein [Chthonomonadales bacterium]